MAQHEIMKGRYSRYRLFWTKDIYDRQGTGRLFLSAVRDNGDSPVLRGDSPVLCADSPVLRADSRASAVNMSEAALALEQYNDSLERIVHGKKEERKLYLGNGCSLTACKDHELELSPMFGNCLVKRLPEGRVFGCLRRHKGYLQTAGLICREDRRPALMNLWASSGVGRITRAGTMSSPFAGEAHDGEYALRRYVRFVSQEQGQRVWKP